MRRDIIRLVVFGLVSSALFAAASRIEEPSTLSGADLFQTKGCIACHTHQGVPESGQYGAAPDLSAVTDIAGDRVGGLEAEAYLRQSIRDPQAFKVPGFEMDMPKLSIADDELDILVAWLLTGDS